MAISILEKPKSKDDSGLRDWAVALLDQNAPIKLPGQTLNGLRSGSLTLIPGGKLALFQLEQDARAHCPSDTVVWLNTNSGIYHEKGTRWYAKTKDGAFVCEREANAAGDRMSRIE